MILVSRILHLPIPFDRDEGAYGYLGWMALSGGQPYVDFYEMKPPLLFYTYAVIVALFGKSTIGLHLAATIINVICTWFVYRLGRELWKSRGAGAIAATAFFVFGMNMFSTGYAMQSEHLVLIFALPGLLCTLRGVSSGNRVTMLWGGVFLACSALIKQTGIFFCLAGLMIVLISALQSGNWRTRKTIGGVLFFAAGGLLPVAVCLLLLLLIGSFDEFWYWIYSYPQRYISNVEADDARALLSRALGGILFGYKHWYILGFISLLLLPFCKTPDWRGKVMIFGLFVLSLCTVLPGFRFYGHYWLCVFPGLALLYPAVFVGIPTFIRNQWWKGISQLLIVLALTLFVAFHFLVNWDRYYKPNFEYVLRAAHKGNYFYSHKRVGDLLNNQIAPDDRLMVFGSEPQIYLYTKKRAPTRHFYTSFTSKAIPEAAGWQQEVIDDVIYDKPEYIVFIVEPISWLFKEASSRTMYNWAYHYMIQGYTTIAYVELNPRGPATIIEGTQAQNYTPASEHYIIISRRNQ
jgi:hypothetical protein